MYYMHYFQDKFYFLNFLISVLKALVKISQEILYKEIQGLFTSCETIYHACHFLFFNFWMIIKNYKHIS